MTAREIADLFEQLELHLIASLKRNLTRHKKQEQDEGGTGGVPEHWEAWQAAKLRDIRRFRRENEAILGEYSPRIEQETENLLREQYAEGGSDGFFHTSDEKLRSLIREMQHNEARVERAALRYMNDVYRKTILRTATAMTAGGMTLHKATDEATKDFLARGINCVRYADGRQVNIASYAEMALRACSTRAMLMGEAKQREKMGVDTVLVSQYGACSDTCLPWQGKVYIDDVFQEYHGPGGGSFGVSRNGRQYLLLSVAIKAGLFHPNCRHTVSTWFEGISTRPKPMNIREIERVNKLEARQRYLERRVREAKRQTAGLTDEAAQAEVQEELEKRQAELDDFLREHDDVLRRDRWRERDTGGPDGEIQKNTLANNADSGILKLGTKYLNKLDSLYEYADKIEPIEGFEDVVTHGDSISLIFRDADGKESNVSAEEFVGILKNDPQYKGGNIRLIACQVAANGGMVPKYIAKHLNVTVMAPTEIVNVDFNGNVILADDDEDARMGYQTGEWLVFEPGKEGVSIDLYRKIR